MSTLESEINFDVLGIFTSLECRNHARRALSLKLPTHARTPGSPWGSRGRVRRSASKHPYLWPYNSTIISLLHLPFSPLQLPTVPTRTRALLEALRRSGQTSSTIVAPELAGSSRGSCPGGLPGARQGPNEHAEALPNAHTSLWRWMIC